MLAKYPRFSDSKYLWIICEDLRGHKSSSKLMGDVLYLKLYLSMKAIGQKQKNACKNRRLIVLFGGPDGNLSLVLFCSIFSFYPFMYLTYCLYLRKNHSDTVLSFMTVYYRHLVPKIVPKIDYFLNIVMQ